METLNSSLPRLAECLNKSGTIRDRARQSCPNRTGAFLCLCYLFLKDTPKAC
jgi:hypothetical protein